MESSRGMIRSSLVILILSITVLVLLSSSSVESASVQKRSILRRENNNSIEECRTNAVCGWEVYNPSTRAHQYYVASSCKCSGKDTCIRTEDDINVPAYLYRCREIRRRPTKPTSRPLNNTEPTPESS